MEAGTERMSHQLLVEGTVAGTTYRKLFCYDLANVDNLRGLKARVLDDMKASGVPLEAASEVVLRNYTLTDYDRTAFQSPGSRSCALSDQDSWSSGPGKGCRLLAATPRPQVPIGTAEDSRHAMLAIASRQLYDRALGGGSVLPLEARVKRASASASAQDAVAAANSISEPNDAAAAEMAQQASSSRGSDTQPFDITVRDFRGRCHSVRVCGGTSVSRLKTGIAKALGCSVVSHWRLMYDGRELEDELDLADYNISAGALVEVQMTSQRNRALAGSAQSAVPSEAKDAAGVGASGGSGGGGGGSGGAGANKSGAIVPNCGAPWASPVKSTAVNQVLVQVLLPCGRVIQLTRAVSEDGPQFVCRVLEAERALLLAPSAATGATTTAAAAADSAVLTATAPVPWAPAAPSEPPGPMRALLPPAKRTPGKAKSAPDARLRKDLRSSGLTAAEFDQPSAGQLKGVVWGQKLLAVLLAAAAVVMAMAVL